VGCLRRSRTIDWPDDDPKAVITETAVAPVAAGRERRGAAQAVAARDQSDGLAAPAGAEYVHSARAARRPPSCDGREGIHLYQFCLRAAHCGSSELWISSLEVTLAALRLRKGARFIYEYDLNIPWRHEVRSEGYLPAEPGKTYPRRTGGAGACPPKDCGGPEGYLAGLDEAVSVEAFEDWDTLIEFLDWVIREGRTELLKDEETRWRLEQALERIEDREHAPGKPFSRQAVNTRLRQGEHRVRR